MQIKYEAILYSKTTWIAYIIPLESFFQKRVDQLYANMVDSLDWCCKNIKTVNTDKLSMAPITTKLDDMDDIEISVDLF